MRKLNLELERTGGLHGYQFGFRAGRSTIDALQAVLEVPNRERGRRWCALILLDVRNAFNCASWGKIVKKLEDSGVDGQLLKIIKSYLSMRSIEVGRGTEIEVDRGVPQGSVLGPTLWNVLYDDVLKLTVPADCRLVAYADDLAALVVDERIQGLVDKGNSILRAIDTWMTAHHLGLAPEKTEAIMLSGRRRAKNVLFELRGNRFEPTSTVVYLGVKLDKGLTFGAHMERECEKASKTTGALTRVMPNVGGPKHSKRKVMAGLIHSILLYAAPVWKKAVRIKRHKNKLAQAQRRMSLRIISGYRTVSTDAALVIAGTIPIWILAEERGRIDRDGGNKAEERNRSMEC